ncbi:TfoX/Sxy family protein [Paludibacterium paludis]|uniref:Competence protein TfoX n=1 Tax=Paludibacterium paludis TaxID=1225769 RepID=A0A918P5M5_9NEIS|nr:TfoX/Sxy family protein [Paludibacterium paludis]GGY22376.1 competence protein TfoX [Paludibacterium paludis]
MASDPDFVDFVCGQMAAAGTITFRKMFGEFAVYLNGKVIGLVCDNQFFLKPTGAGRLLLGVPVEAPPYPGAKPHFLIGEQLDETDLLTRLVRDTARALPEPKPKKPRAPKNVK